LRRRRASIALLLLFGCLSVSACKTISTPNPEWESKAGVKLLRFRWQKRLSPVYLNFLIPELQEEHDRFNPVEFGEAAFDTDKRRAFIGSTVGGLYCLDIRTGTTVWRFEVDDPVGSVPLYDENRKYVYFGADDGRFYALHARSGRLIWSLDTGAEIRKGSLMYNNTLYIVSADNTIFALDPDSGEIVWQYRRPPLKGFSAAGHSGLLIGGGKLITGFSDGYIVALDATGGAVVWSSDLAAEIETGVETGEVKLSDVDATPVIVGDILVAASVDGGIRGLNVETGNVIWTNPALISVTGLAASNGTVYAARSAFGISAIDPKTGKEQWSKRFRSGMLADPVVYEDLLLISDSVFGLFAVSTLDGQLLQQVNQYKGFFARPSVHAGYLLIIGNGSTLYAMSIL
jgi:outer membrane protein assembly factor BamB